MVSQLNPSLKLQQVEEMELEHSMSPLCHLSLEAEFSPGGIWIVQLCIQVQHFFHLKAKLGD